MPTFEEAVLALSPLLFWRCKDLFGSQITDYSGNGYHGNVVSGSVILGQQPLVETDPLSRSVYIPGGFANNIAEIETPPAPLLFTGDFTIACFAIHEETLGSQYLCARGGIANSTSQGLHFLATGSDERTLRCWYRTTDGTNNHTVEVVAQFPHTIGVNHFHVATRNGIVTRLYTDGILTGEDTDGNLEPLLLGSSNRLRFGSAGNNLAPLQGWGAELIIFDYALSASQVAAVHSSARRRVAMSLVINMGTRLNLDLTPPPVYNAFQIRHNWASPLVERLSRATSVQMSKDGTEARTGKSTKTRRRYAYNSLVGDALTQRQFTAFLRNNLRKPVALPVLTDSVRLNAAASAGATALSLDTQYRAFDAGSRVMLATSDTEFEVAEIEDVDNVTGSVTLADPLEIGWPKHTTAQPAKLAYLEQEIRPTSLTRDIQTLPVTASMLVQDVPLSPNDVTPFTPGYMYRTVEVFDPFQWGLNDYSEGVQHSIQQVSELRDAETGIFDYDSDITVAHDGIAYNLTLVGREQISLFRGWFEARAGRLNKLWVPTMVKDIGEYIQLNGGVSTSNLVISGSNYAEDYDLDDHRRDFAFVKKDRTFVFRRINSYGTSGSNETLNVQGSHLVLPSVTQTRYICFLRMCRLDADEVELVWLTNDKVKVSLLFREVLNEIP